MSRNQPHPILIQGGMGVGVSSCALAQSVSKAGHLGVVSGTALDMVLARSLQVGDPGGHRRRALSHFPLKDVAARILKKYFVEGGKDEGKPFKSIPVPSLTPNRMSWDLLIAGNFVEVFLAKEGHDGLVGVNFLEKIQPPHLGSAFGAMLAGVDVVLMGAGIPRTMPGILDNLAIGQPVEYVLDVVGADRKNPVKMHFDPAEYWGSEPPKLKRPDFYAIIASATLAAMLKKRATGKVDGFIVEGPLAGGHNAPPRGQLQLSVEGEPVYGDRDVPDLSAIAALGLPFWLAGDFARPDAFKDAMKQGAAGVQIGTAFAYCEESGMPDDVKNTVLQMSSQGNARVFTDPVASPTGFPFKVVQLDDTLSNPDVYAKRSRICDLGYLRQGYIDDSGDLKWRCPSEPIDDYVRKGGEEKDTVGRKCVCNGLMSNIGLGQVQKDGYHELTLITSGDDVKTVSRFLKPSATSYTAQDVIDFILGDSSSAELNNNEETVCAH